jgi:2-polyprenyl-3-methyl-5-hydroxy-6-metoxy-1,4-benzoquinol methylase
MVCTVTSQKFDSGSPSELTGRASVSAFRPKPAMCLRRVTESRSSVNDERREYETHWKMNAATRAVFDRVTDAAVAGLPPAGAGGRTVLDIGCGGQSNVVFPDADRVVGVDVDEAGLNRNTTITEKLLMSVDDFEPGEYSADAIACIFTLEHVEEPDVVFGKLARSLKPGGVMVIAVPQVRSPKALVTRYTPQSVHEWFYRRVLGRDPETAGTPFETVLDPAI